MFIHGPDARYLSGSAVLFSKDVAAFAAGLESAGDVPSNDPRRLSGAVREHEIGRYGSPAVRLELKISGVQGVTDHFVVLCPTDTGNVFRRLLAMTDVPQVIADLRAAAELGERLRATI
ncbi:MAG TPA: hypothetical protein VN694_14860 [Caulobacteraceae bacterium]|nr:hypothetical protein [Caulobacteraceae bacterium]